VVRASVDRLGADAWEQLRRTGQPVNESEDAREGALAFAQRRAPAWRGR
jgi:enoyl-CoA hydratase